VAIGDVGESTRCAGPSVLVLGNAGAVYGGDVSVTLMATRITSNDVSATDHSIAGASAADVSARHFQEERDECRKRLQLLRGSRTSLSPVQQRASVSEPVRPGDTRRVFFLPTTVRPQGKESGIAAIPCRLSAENSRIRIYVDERLPPDESLTNLIDAINTASASRLGEIVEELVGSVRDVDHDGRFSVVVTPDVSRLGNGRTPVDGLTNPADFLPGIDRPFGNGSDVIFLNSRLSPGDHLRAVLAHEWCHAAAFSRQLHGPGTQPGRPSEDDWLNEALAHVVEVRASGSVNNLSHRIDSYRACPGDSPLVVRDYSQPEFWRHDGCRGAAFLFLQWCLEQSDNSLLERLAQGRSSGVEGLEAAMGRPFEELFLGWTTSLGEHLANEPNGHSNSATGFGARQSATGLSHHKWQLGPSGELTLTLRIRGSCAEFVRIEHADHETWRLSAGVSTPDLLQATLIPVNECVKPVKESVKTERP
jgi:hypothetical protein